MADPNQDRQSFTAELVRNLLRSEAFPDPTADIELLQTHISYVILAGEYAYKIKKPLDLGFLDFSTLELRKHFCEEELRLNRRLAPRIYLDVVGITGPVDRPAIGGQGRPVEYAVKMRRFPQSALLSGRELSGSLMQRIGTKAAAFHESIPQAGAETRFGSPEAVFAPMDQNFHQIRDLVSDSSELDRLARIESWTRSSYRRLKSLLARRKDEGRIRECHGDMHLGNIALIGDEVTIFDGIEFSPDLRWIDTMNEVAFLVMDLEYGSRTSLAQQFLNSYLEASGDFEGLALLDFYKVYRAMVRAKVTAIRLDQSDLSAEDRDQTLAVYRTYASLAEGYTRPRKPGLIITRGLSGSGKSHYSRALAETEAMIHVRSDVERKRMHNLSANSRTDSDLHDGIYSAAATEKTYTRLLDLSRQVLSAGYRAVVDATFLKQAQREPFLRLAREMNCAFLILDIQAPDRVLRERIRQRGLAAIDPSEADESVLDYQLASEEPLTEAEKNYFLYINSSDKVPIDRVVTGCIQALG